MRPGKLRRGRAGLNAVHNDFSITATMLKQNPIVVTWRTGSLEVLHHYAQLVRWKVSEHELNRLKFKSSHVHSTLNPKPLNPKPLNPKPLNPEP